MLQTAGWKTMDCFIEDECFSPGPTQALLLKPLFTYFSGLYCLPLCPAFPYGDDVRREAAHVLMAPPSISS